MIFLLYMPRDKACTGPLNQVLSNQCAHHAKYTTDAAHCECTHAHACSVSWDPKALAVHFKHTATPQGQSLSGSLGSTTAVGVQSTCQGAVSAPKFMLCTPHNTAHSDPACHHSVKPKSLKATPWHHAFPDTMHPLTHTPSTCCSSSTWVVVAVHGVLWMVWRARHSTCLVLAAHGVRAGLTGRCGLTQPDPPPDPAAHTQHTGQGKSAVCVTGTV
jgi:hypothetical protein